jgi:hypothetical protein
LKKEAKNFWIFGGAPVGPARLNDQTFFGSFFQKRSASCLFVVRA